MRCDICGREIPRIYKKSYDNGKYCRVCMSANLATMRPIKIPIKQEGGKNGYTI